MKKIIIAAAAAIGIMTMGSGSFSVCAEDALGPVVTASDESPTGYYVTFNYADREADRVRIYGEWLFSDPEHTSIAGGTDTQPQDYEKGDYLFARYGWDYQDMELNEETGNWSLTIPLPGGTYSYRFYVGGDAQADVTDISEAVCYTDPGNPAYLPEDRTDFKDEELFSTVWVPYNEEYQTAEFDCAIEEPKSEKNGEYVYLSVTLDDGTEYPFGMYLPYEFDVNREEEYPLFVLYHNNDYTTWANEGALPQIMDNLIAEGKVEPTVVVTPAGGSGFRHEDGTFDSEGIIDALVNHIMPYVEENYNVSAETERHAISGLSRSGSWVYYAYFHYTNEFKYYFAMSAVPSDVNADYDNPDLESKTLVVNLSMFDTPKTFSLVYYDKDENGNYIPYSDHLEDVIMNGNVYEIPYELYQRGISFTTYGETIPLGHCWAFWRKMVAHNMEYYLWK